MQKILILVLVFAAALVLLSYLPVHGEEEIYENVVRLHVIANSDSDEDQALKLSVRDGILVIMESLLADCHTREEAEAAVRESIGLIEETAQKTIAEQGYSYPVSVTLGREEYPRKSYEAVCFPAGVYSSLQIKIGEAEGKNWWCVLFPQLCLSAAKNQNAESAFIEVGLTPDQYRVITETEDTKYKMRFRILELIEDAFGN